MTEPRPNPLLAGLAAGDEAAFAALYDRFGARLFRAALGMLGSREEAEDAVQDTFTGLVRARAGLAGVENLAGYLFAALRRAAG
jgi:RNA polymerase sigma-70 factor (ECF subfamily)